MYMEVNVFNLNDGCEPHIATKNKKKNLQAL